MIVPYELTGRTSQKARTREALVSAARALLARGVDPTVEDTAREASVSRTTAYRYFPNQQALVVATYPEMEATSLLGSQPPADPRARLDLASERFAAQLLEHEPELRAALRVSLGMPAATGPALRTGRAVMWFEDALAPLRESLGQAGTRRLAIAIRATLGIEALIWLTDVAGLPREEAVELMRESARALLEAALA